MSLPGDPAFLSLLRSFVDDVAGRCLKSERRDALADAAELAFAAIVGDARPQREPIHVVAACREELFELSMTERGLPLDDAYVRRDSRWTEILARVDGAHWELHSSGSTLRLTVQHDVSVATTEAASAAMVEQAPEQTYCIRRFEPKDGPGIARCFFEAWDFHYPVKAVYEPERLIKLNASGAVVSFVALDETGDVVGHYGLTRYTGAPIAEGGMAAVRSAHRGRSLAERLREAAEREAPGLGFVGLYFEPVTDHVFTQKLNEKFGAHICAILLGESPRSFVQPGMELSATGQRQSFLLYARSLSAPAARAAYAPPRHQPMIARIYAGLGLPVNFLETGAAGSDEAPIEVTLSAADRIGTIAVRSITDRTGPATLQALDDLRSTEHLAAVYVRLPLRDPAMPQLSDALEGIGCFFSGIEPWVLGGFDAFRLQYIARPLDLTKLEILSPFGRELLTYISENRRGRAKARLLRDERASV